MRVSLLNSVLSQCWVLGLLLLISSSKAFGQQVRFREPDMNWYAADSLLHSREAFFAEQLVFTNDSKQVFNEWISKMNLVNFLSIRTKDRRFEMYWEDSSIERERFVGKGKWQSSGPDLLSGKVTLKAKFKDGRKATWVGKVVAMGDDCSCTFGEVKYELRLTRQ